MPMTLAKIYLCEQNLIDIITYVSGAVHPALCFRPLPTLVLPVKVAIAYQLVIVAPSARVLMPW